MIKKSKIVKKSSIVLGSLGILLAAPIVPIAHSGHAFADGLQSSLEDKTSIVVKDVTIDVGEQWNYLDNIVSLTDKDGNSASAITSDDEHHGVEASYSFDTSKPIPVGTYNITYAFRGKTVISHLNVKEASKTVSGTATDEITTGAGEGSKTVSGTAAAPGATNSTAGPTSAQVTDLSSIKTYSHPLHIGDSWKFTDNLDQGTSIDGRSVDLIDDPNSGTIAGISSLLGGFTFDVKDPTGVLVNGKVVKDGTFQVNYHFGIDLKKTETVTITVLPNSFNAIDSTIYAYEPWTPADNFPGGRDVATVKVTGSVNVTQPGIYPITYSFAGYSKTINVTVKENKIGIITQNTTLHVGDTWDSNSNIAGYIDQEGNFTHSIQLKTGFEISFPDNDGILKGDGKVVKPGKFTVVYTICQPTRSEGGTTAYSNLPFRSASATVTVLP